MIITVNYGEGKQDGLIPLASRIHTKYLILPIYIAAHTGICVHHFQIPLGCV